MRLPTKIPSFCVPGWLAAGGFVEFVTYPPANAADKKNAEAMSGSIPPGMARETVKSIADTEAA